jgi:hypothetical protein
MWMQLRRPSLQAIRAAELLPSAKKANRDSHKTAFGRNCSTPFPFHITSIVEQSISNTSLQIEQSSVPFSHQRYYATNSQSSQNDAQSTNTKTNSATETISSFYKRPLPNHLIPFSSEQGKELFKEAIADGKMESYWTLAEQFHTQSEPACMNLVL